ncbi:30S ribosomal protein S7 [Candidatus Daviesbacteria bacterium]|nr:30S ribosomal protein S7 [Candidatus Daviesbacteria bacterium]
MRSKKAEKRIIVPDPLYNSRLLAKFINKVMKEGKKSTAQTVVYKALEIIKEQSKQEPLGVFEKALQNVSPKMEVKPRRVGGASYQVPIEVRGDRKEALSIRWVITGARARSNSTFHTFAQKLAAELLDAANNTGSAIKKRDDMLRMANANRAFAHFRW